jgi:hypothetical protein
MTEKHGYFEMLCALAASGQLTRSEAAELREHAPHCDACRSRNTEWNLLGAQLWVAHAWKDQNARLPGGMKERFVTRAIREGVPLSHHASHRVSLTHTEQLGLVAIIVLAVSMFLIAHKPAPLHRSPVDHGGADDPPVSTSTRADVRKPQESLSKLLAGNPVQNHGRNFAPANIVRGDFQGHRASAVSRHGLVVGRSAPAPWSNADAPATTRALPTPQFAFTGYSQKGTPSALIPPAITLRVLSRPEGNLLAECEYCAFSFSNSPVGRTFVPLPAQTPRAMLSFAVSRPTPYFKMDPVAFQLIKSVGP